MVRAVIRIQCNCRMRLARRERRRRIRDRVEGREVARKRELGPREHGGVEGEDDEEERAQAAAEAAAVNAAMAAGQAKAAAEVALAEAETAAARAAEAAKTAQEARDNVPPPPSREGSPTREAGGVRREATPAVPSGTADCYWAVTKMAPPPLPGTHQPLLPSPLPSPRTFRLPESDPHRRAYGLHNAPPLKPRPPRSSRHGRRQLSPRPWDLSPREHNDYVHNEYHATHHLQSSTSRLLSPRGFTRGGVAAPAPWESDAMRGRLRGSGLGGFISPRDAPLQSLAPLQSRPNPPTQPIRLRPAQTGPVDHGYYEHDAATSMLMQDAGGGSLPWPKVWPAREPAVQRGRPSAAPLGPLPSCTAGVAGVPGPGIPVGGGTPVGGSLYLSRDDEEQLVSLWAEAGGRFWAHGAIN